MKTPRYNYYEVLMIRCSVPDCEWSFEASWSDMDKGGPVERAWNEHVATHQPSDFDKAVNW